MDEIYRLIQPRIEFVMDKEERGFYINRSKLIERDIDIHDFKFTLEMMSNNFYHHAEHTVYAQVNPRFHKYEGRRTTSYDLQYINFKIVEKEVKKKLVRSLRISYNKDERDYIYIEELPLKILIRMFHEFTKEIGLKFSTRIDLEEIEHYIRKDDS